MHFASPNLEYLVSPCFILAAILAAPFVLVACAVALPFLAIGTLYKHARRCLRKRK